MKEKCKKQIITILLVAIFVCIGKVPACAKSIDLRGYKYYSSAKCTTYMTGTLKSNWNSVTFTGKTGGSYSGTKTPDKIVHKDVIKTTGIGSISVSGTSASSSVSGNTTTESYTATKKKSVLVYPTYTGAASLVTFWVKVSANTTYKFGSTYIVVSTGDASIAN